MSIQTFISASAVQIVLTSKWLATFHRILGVRYGFSGGGAIQGKVSHTLDGGGA